MEKLNEDQVKLLQHIRTNRQNPHAIYDSIIDPCELTNLKTPLKQKESLGLTQYAIEHSNAEASEEFGISVRTVERHRAYWLDNSDADKIQFAKRITIDDRLCGAMRCAALEGDSTNQISERYKVSKGSVFNHVSDSPNASCSHQFPVSVERTSFK